MKSKKKKSNRVRSTFYFFTLLLFYSFTFKIPLLLFYFLKVVLLDILEVAECANLELVCSSLVSYDDAVLVELKNRDSPHLCNRTLNSCLKRACLVVTVYEDHHLAS